MATRFFTVTFDAHDPVTLSRFWAAVLDWQVVFEAPDEVCVAKHDDADPAFSFCAVDDAKAGKNRIHVDLAPDDRDAEVERILGLGATRVDVGQTGEETWVVLADPEGNEFCVLSAREGGV